MTLAELKAELNSEVAAILASDFSISVTDTRIVPHFADGSITFPNLDDKTQGSKLLETTVLYVDMRRSTELSFKHKRTTAAKLYSAFVRAMIRTARHFGGEVRGIIGDRVMVIFDQADCFANAINTATLMNSVCKYVINKNFSRGEVEFGIGVDYGRMLVTKTGMRRHGHAQQNYRALVWLGRPANVASKLTDAANKPEESIDLDVLKVWYDFGYGLISRIEYPSEFCKSLTRAPSGMVAPGFQFFEMTKEKYVRKAETPPLLITESVYQGLRLEAPKHWSIEKSLWSEIPIGVSGHTGKIFGGDMVYPVFAST